jgi:hypothetical protein
MTKKATNANNISKAHFMFFFKPTGILPVPPKSNVRDHISIFLPPTRMTLSNTPKSRNGELTAPLGPPASRRRSPDFSPPQRNTVERGVEKPAVGIDKQGTPQSVKTRPDSPPARILDDDSATPSHDPIAVWTPESLLQPKCAVLPNALRAERDLP